MNQLPLTFTVGKFTRLGAVLPDNLSLSDWKALWQPLRDLGGSVRLIRGDWLNYGASKFAAPIELDADKQLSAEEREKAHRRRVNKFAASLTSNKEDYRALAYEAWVSRSVPIVRRRKTLTWSHYVEVAALEPKDQEKYLNLAETGGLSAGQLRRELRTKRSSKDEPQINPSGFVVGAWVDEGIRNLRLDEIRDWSAPRREQLRRDLTRLAEHLTTLDVLVVAAA